MKPTLFSLLPCMALAVLVGAGCKTATVTSERDISPPTTAKPVVIYIADFEVGVVKHQDGILSGRQGPVGRVSERLYGTSSDPETRARELVELMGNSLLKELTKAGFAAQRLSPGRAMPRQGWLLRGVFTEVQEGNRLQRAMIGFGQGQTDIQVVTTIDDLSQGTPKPMYEVATDANSGSNTPGAAPTLVFGPYGAAARFVMAGHDLEKNVKQTAAQIADRLAKRMQPPS